VVTVLMQELSANNENDWAEHLVGEMVEGAASFKHSQDAMHILKESLALSCFGEEFVGEQLKAGHYGLYHCLASVLCAVLCIILQHLIVFALSTKHLRPVHAQASSWAGFLLAACKIACKSVACHCLNKLHVNFSCNNMTRPSEGHHPPEMSISV